MNLARKNKTGWVLNGRRPTLATLLKALGVVEPSRATGRAVAVGANKSESRLWDLFERAEAAYKKAIRSAHPDRGGNNRDAATLNQIWSRLKKLFAKKGISRA